MSNVAGENKRKVKKTKTDTTNIKVSTEDKDDPIQTKSNEKKSDEKKKREIIHQKQVQTIKIIFK